MEKPFEFDSISRATPEFTFGQTAEKAAAEPSMLDLRHGRQRV
jgi:hypothetical protein